MNKKYLKKSILIFLPVILIILLMSLYFNYVDTIRVVHGERPKYCIKYWKEDGSKVIYLGLFYKVVAYTGVSPKEPYKNHLYKKMVPWFSDYKKPLDYKKKDSKVKAVKAVKKIKQIKNIDDFYNTSLTKEMDIRNLTKKYSSFDAKKDKVFFIDQYAYIDENKKAFDEFYDNYKKGKNAYLRVGVNTREGDLLLYDILYGKDFGGLFLVSDYTRDRFALKQHRVITFDKYDKLSVEKVRASNDKEDKNVLVLYNGKKYNPALSQYKSVEIGTIK